jgi:hypothetical protein
MIEFTMVIVVKCKGPISAGLQIITSNITSWITLLVDWMERSIPLFQNLDCSFSWPIEDKMVKLATMIIVKCKCPISTRPQIIASNTSPWITLLINWMEHTIPVSEDPDCSCTWPIENKIVELATMIIVKCKCPISTRPQIIASNTSPWITLLINWMEHTIPVSEDPDCSCTWPIENKMVELATMIIVKYKCLISTRPQIIASNTSPWITLLINWMEYTIPVSEDPDCSCTWPIENKIVELATMIIVKCKHLISIRP